MYVFIYYTKPINSFGGVSMNMNRGLITGTVFVIMAVMIALMMMPMLLSSLDEVQVDTISKTVNSTTGVGETTEDVEFAEPLYEDDTAYVDSITSDNGADTPTASSYTAATDTLTVGGLAASGTRVITIAYTSDALDGYTGMSDMVKMTGFIIMAALVIAAFAGIYHSAKG